MDVLKFTVENLAKIRRAEVEIRPLTIFFGKNNTNKSYMAHVVYGLVEYLPEIVLQKLDLFLTKAPKELLITKTNENEIVNKIIADLEKRISELFRARNRTEKLKLSGIQEYIKNYVKENIEEFYPKETKPYNEEFSYFSESEREELKISRAVAIIRSIIVSRAKKLARDVIYFPASRTGFVLAFDALITGIIKERYGLEKPYEKLTEPVIDFLAKFNNIRSLSESLVGKSVKNPILGRLSEIIGGEIWVDEKNKQLYYHPKGTRGMKKIEMHLVSSSVTELAPLYVFLANEENIKNTFFIIEEPEAHLHPENQIKITELIVQLVNMGATVLITTHSDYILNTVNICLQRFWAEEKEKPAINPELVSAYLFREERRQVKVSALDIEYYEGISFENFYPATDILIEEEENLRRKLKKVQKDV